MLSLKSATHAVLGSVVAATFLICLPTDSLEKQQIVARCLDPRHSCGRPRGNRGSFGDWPMGGLHHASLLPLPWHLE